MHGFRKGRGKDVVSGGKIKGRGDTSTGEIPLLAPTPSIGLNKNVLQVGVIEVTKKRRKLCDIVYFHYLLNFLNLKRMILFFWMVSFLLHPLFLVFSFSNFV